MNNIIECFFEKSSPEYTEEIINTTIEALDKILSFYFSDKIFIVSLTYTGEEEIKELNREYRDTDKTTDVLSFPQYEYDSPMNPCGDFEEGEILLGDIIISIPAAIKQADEYGHSLLRENVFLAVHSLLHLLGYDHMTEDERAEMEEKQRELMAMLKIER